MEWARLPGRGKLLIRFEKSAERKLKCARRLRSLASALARARGSEASQFYLGARGVLAIEPIISHARPPIHPRVHESN